MVWWWRLPGPTRWTSFRPTAALQGGVAAGLPRFCGGLAGYFGYDTVRHIEKEADPQLSPDTLGCPDILLLQCEELASSTTSRQAVPDRLCRPAQPQAYARAQARLQELRQRLDAPVKAPVVKPAPSAPQEREFAKADYIAAVERARS